MEQGRRRSFHWTRCLQVLPSENTCFRRLVESRGLTNHSGRTAMDTACHRGWLVCEQRVQWGNVFLSQWFFLKQFCFVRLFFPTRLWAWDSFINKLRLSFAPCMCVFSIVRCVYIIGFVVASFALWFCDCVILLSISLTDDDIKIQRRHIELGNNELKRQLATNDRWAAGTEATKLFSAEFHPNVALSTENGVAKIHWSGDWFEGWICARKRCCRFDFC